MTYQLTRRGKAGLPGVGPPPMRRMITWGHDVTSLVAAGPDDLVSYRHAGAIFTADDWAALFGPAPNWPPPPTAA